MADFQTTVNREQALGIPGAFATNNPGISAPIGYVAGDDVKIGSFVWADTNGNAVNTGTGVPVGFVARVIAYGLDDRGVSTDVAKKGDNLNVQVKGDFYAVATTAATVGQKVFAVEADGTIATGTAGSTIAGAVETGWVVATAGAVGETIIISNY